MSSEIGDDNTTPRWWIILWTAWGLVVAGIILWLDRQPWSAAPWSLGGIVMAFFGSKPLLPLDQSIFDWYHQLNPDLEQIEEREFALLEEGKLETKEFEQCLEEEVFWMHFMIPPFFGMFHGVLVGAIFG